MKLKFTDDIGGGGGGKLKFLDDIGGKLKFRDDAKLKVRDDIKFKNVDDVKAPFLDKGFDRDPGRGFPGPRAGQPGRRPFILSTPHHAQPGVPQASGPAAEAAALEAELQQLASTIEAGLQEIEAMGAAYNDLLATYEATYGRG